MTEQHNLLPQKWPEQTKGALLPNRCLQPAPVRMPALSLECRVLSWEQQDQMANPAALQSCPLLGFSLFSARELLFPSPKLHWEALPNPAFLSWPPLC